MSAWPLRYVISGGQTGADQAGLRAARDAGYATGGMMPKGFRTDAGPNPDLARRYNLVESHQASYGPRTAWNVRAAQGTVWFGTTTSPGYRLTKQCCAADHRPFLENPVCGNLRAWIALEGIVTLNVAGNRERTNPGIGERTWQVVYHAILRESV